MNALFFNFLKKTYRKESVSSFILVFGAVDVVIGGVGGKLTLLSFGLSMVVASIILRWYKLQQAEAIVADKPSRYFLPPSESRPPLPLLTKKKPHQ